MSINWEAFFVRRFLQDLKQYYKGLVLCALFLFFLEAVLGKTCLFRILFGMPCPGCGLSRAASLLTQGRLEESLTVHPFLIPLLFVLVLWAWERYGRNRSPRLSAAAALLCFTGMVLFYAWRITRYFPQTPPMVYEPDNLLHSIFRLIQGFPNPL